MIEYTPNRDWSRDLIHLGASAVMRRLFRYVLFVGAYAAAVVAACQTLLPEGFRLASGAFTSLGVILSIILGFRTNAAYDRWWEGRKLWGALANHSRNLAVQVDASFPADDAEVRTTFARLLGDFAVALSGHLRGAVDFGALEGRHDPARGGRPFGPAVGNVPAAIARQVVAEVHAGHRARAIDSMDVLAMKPHTQALLDVSGACERIRKTPIPFSYSIFIKAFISVYAALLPFGLVPDYGYMAVPLVMLIVFALLGLEMMAGEIEEPFGLDCNDLPTHTLARGIRADVADLLGVEADAPAPPKPVLYEVRQ